MATDLNTIIPGFSVNIINPGTGQIDPIWYQFLLKIFDRTEAIKNAVTDVTGIAPITSTGGTTPAISIIPATGSNAGSMSALDKAKLDSVTTGAAVSGVGGLFPISSTGGVAPVISISNATPLLDGSMTASDKAKLNGIGTGATVTGVTGTAPIVSSGGAAPAISISAATPSTAGSLSAADKTKLDSVTSGAAVATVTGTAPIVSSGGASPAISILAATGSVPGSMSAADKAKLDLLIYRTGTWTPTITFVTSGNLAVTYGTQIGHYTQIGRKISCDFEIVTTGFNWTTSSGTLQITGLPFAANNTIPEFAGTLSWSGIAIIGYMSISASILSSSPSLIQLIASGDNKPRAILGTGNAPSGNTFVLVGQIEYFI